MASSQVKVEVIQANEFPDVSERFKVGAVPTLVINNRVEVVGAAPEGYVLDRLLGRRRAP